MVKNHKLFAVIALFMFCPISFAQECFYNAHSHNDYNRGRPLFDAFEGGFRSIEADVFLRNGKLYVAHSEEEIDSFRTLESMYLEPLFKLLNKSAAPCSSYILLIDIKEDGENVYSVLDRILEKYSSVLTQYKRNDVSENKLTIVISGDRPIEEMEKDTTRYASVDGRLGDMNKSAYLYSMISDDWFMVQEYIKKNMDEKHQEDSLKELALIINKNKKLFRIWGTPDNEKSWQLQYEAGVSLIGTDNIAGLTEFLSKMKQTK